MAIALSKASKMPCRSWSLQALDTCPGSRNTDGTLVPACSGCYATTGNYVFSNVKTPRVNNRLDWARPDWVSDMVRELNNDRFFRWFDSGDVYHPGLAAKIYEVMQKTPWCNHWLPTRSYKIPRIRTILEQMKELPNVVVRYSSDSIDGSYTEGLHGSTIIPTADHPTNVKVCDAYQRKGKCGPCRVCWSKDVPVVGYPAHGRVMLARIRRIKRKTKAKPSKIAA